MALRAVAGGTGRVRTGARGAVGGASGPVPSLSLDFTVSLDPRVVLSGGSALDGSRGLRVEAGGGGYIGGADFAAFYNQPEGTFWMEMELADSSNVSRFLTVYDDSFVRLCDLFTNGFNDLTNFNGCTGGGQTDVPPGIHVGGVIRLTVAYKANDYQIAIDGAVGVVDTSITMDVTATQMTIGCWPPGSNSMTGWVRKVKYYNSHQPLIG